MLIKTILSLMIISLSTYTGYLKSNILKQRIKVLERFIYSIKIIETDMNYSKNYLTDILSKLLGNNVLSDFFFNIISNIEISGLQASWQNALEQSIFYQYLTEDDIDLIKDFANSFGNTDVENQNKMFQYYTEKFQMLLAEAQNDYNSKYKIYRSLGFAIGMALTVILI